MLATLIEPDGGEATVAGVDLRSHPGEVRRRIGYVAQGGSTWDDSTAREELVLQARHVRHRQGRGAARGPPRRSTRSSSPSTPTASARRTPAASGAASTSRSASSTSPKVVFLDEPTTGLDPQSRAHMWDEIRRLRDEGMTVFLTTHYLDEADALCDRVAIMDHGQIVAEGTPDELKREVSGDVVTVGLNGATPKAAEAARHRGVRAASWRPMDDGVRLYVDEGATAIPLILRTLDGAGHRLDLDRAAPAQPRRRVPDQDRPIAAGELTTKMKLVRDTWLIFHRQMQLVLRNPVWVFVGVVQPLYLPVALRDRC